MKRKHPRIFLIKKQNKPTQYISLQEQIKANQISSELLKIEAKTNHSLAHNFAGSKQS
jgi:hypothetical protein